jgi:glutamate-1-semialdehyde 2,1-aminomutase
MLTLFFSDAPINGYTSAKRADTQRYAHFFHAALDAGVYFPPSQFEAVFVSDAHDLSDIDATISAVHQALATL